MRGVDPKVKIPIPRRLGQSRLLSNTVVWVALAINIAFLPFWRLRNLSS